MKFLVDELPRNIIDCPFGLGFLNREVISCPCGDDIGCCPCYNHSIKDECWFLKVLENNKKTS